MEDWVALSAAPTRWKLLRAIRLVNQTLAEVKVQNHPCIGLMLATAAGGVWSVQENSVPRRQIE